MLRVRRLGFQTSLLVATAKGGVQAICNRITTTPPYVLILGSRATQADMPRTALHGARNAEEVRQALQDGAEINAQDAGGSPQR